MLKRAKSLLVLSIILTISILQISPCSSSDEVWLPILMYHHFEENVENDMIVSPETFEAHISALSSAGYTAITFDELCSHVESGSPLPEKPICITMDDGYLSNYEIAYPILQKYNMKATVFLIGSMAGATNYPVTGYPLIPYFTWEQAKEMHTSGTLDIQCHTYGMHHYAPYEDGSRPVRENIMPLEGESDADYAAFLIGDIGNFAALSDKMLGKSPTVLAYPNGKWCALSEEILRSLGFKVTLTTNPHSNLIKSGSKDTLYRLGRYTVTESISAEELLKMIK